MEIRLGRKKEEPPVNAGGNGHGDINELKQAVFNLAQTQGRIIEHLNQRDRPTAANVATTEEKRDLLDKVIDPPRRILPAMSNISPMMAFLIPNMDIIKSH